MSSLPPGILTSVPQDRKSILHVGVREIIVQLRDEVLKLQGHDVVSTGSIDDGLRLFGGRRFDLVLVDVEGQGRVPEAEQFCEEIRAALPGQKVAFVCNHSVSIESDCPDEIIQAQFNPIAFIKGVAKALE